MATQKSAVKYFGALAQKIDCKIPIKAATQITSKNCRPVFSERPSRQSGVAVLAIKIKIAE